jgi:hypothetical protein
LAQTRLGNRLAVPEHALEHIDHVGRSIRSDLFAERDAHAGEHVGGAAFALATGNLGHLPETQLRVPEPRTELFHAGQVEAVAPLRRLLLVIGQRGEAGEGALEVAAARVVEVAHFGNRRSLESWTS